MPFVKGKSGNPKGRRPKGNTFTDIINANVDKVAIVAKLEELGMNGDVAALKYLCDRLEGTPTQAVKVGGLEDAPPVTINIVGVETENS
jgi:hypothetical protein